MKNLPRPVRAILLIAALLAIIGFWYLAWRTAVKTANAPAPAAEENKNVGSDFARAGTVTFDNPGLKPNTPYFIFEEPGSPALSKELIFDKDSVCVSPTGESRPCFSLDAAPGMPYNEKRTLVEGVSRSDGSLLVKKISFEK